MIMLYRYHIRFVLSNITVHINNSRSRVLTELNRLHTSRPFPTIPRKPFYILGLHTSLNIAIR